MKSLVETCGHLPDPLLKCVDEIFSEKNEMYVNNNTPYRFTIAMPFKMKLVPDKWEVGLTEIFIPNYGFNIKAP